MKHLFSCMIRTLFFAFLLLTTASFVSSTDSDDNPEPRKKAKHAANKLYELMPNAGLSKDQFHDITYFIETKLSRWVKRYGNYLSYKKTHLQRSLEYDPDTGDVYIHLGVHGGVKRLGKGSKKTVTQSILYHPEYPKKMAQCKTNILIRGESKAIKALKHVTGLAKVRSILKRQSASGRKSYSFFYNLYNAGSLSKAIKQSKFSHPQKLEIMSDMLRALDALHASHFVHRDICPQNFLVEKLGSHYRAVLSDFGRTMEVKEAQGRTAQGHRFFNPPEALVQKNLKKNSYFMADVYATGCVLYKLFYEKDMPWMYSSYIKDKTQSVKTRAAQYKSHLTKFYKKEMSLIKRDMKKNPSRKAALQAKTLIMQMMHPNPKKRGTARQLNSTMRRIVDHTKWR